MNGSILTIEWENDTNPNFSTENTSVFQPPGTTIIKTQTPATTTISENQPPETQPPITTPIRAPIPVTIISESQPPVTTPSDIPTPVTTPSNTPTPGTTISKTQSLVSTTTSETQPAVTTPSDTPTPVTSSLPQPPLTTAVSQPTVTTRLPKPSTPSNCRVLVVIPGTLGTPIQRSLQAEAIKFGRGLTFEVDSNCEAAYLMIPINMECKVSLMNPYKSSKTSHILKQNMKPVTLGVRDPSYNEYDPIDSPTIEINYEKPFNKYLCFKLRTDDSSKALISGCLEMDMNTMCNGLFVTSVDSDTD
ncbi:unnamed protein product [Gordionus sp. m RMFG-2023]